MSTIVSVTLQSQTKSSLRVTQMIKKEYLRPNMQMSHNACHMVFNFHNKLTYNDIASVGPLLREVPFHLTLI